MENMAQNNKSISLLLRGTEEASVLVEDYANFLRDLVFIHDRIWILASPDERFSKLYYSNWFYVRGQQRVPEKQMLELRSAQIGSPFELKVKLDFGDQLQKAARAFLDLLRGLITLPEYKKKEKLKNRLLKAAVLKEEIEVQALKTSQDSRARTLLEELRSLPALQDQDWKTKVHILQNDVQRLSESRLRITSVEVESETKKAEK